MTFPLHNGWTPAVVAPNVAPMLRYALKRLLSLIISLAIASLIIFFVIEVAPGDPAQFMLGLNAQPDTVAAFAAWLLLDVDASRYSATDWDIRHPEHHREWLDGQLYSPAS